MRESIHELPYRLSTGLTGYTLNPSMDSFICGERVTIFAHVLATTLPCLRLAGAESSYTGQEQITASGWAADSSRKKPARPVSCCPSASICSTWVRPSSEAFFTPAKTAAPFPEFFCSVTRTTAGQDEQIFSRQDLVSLSLPSSTMIIIRPRGARLSITAPTAGPWLYTGIIIPCFTALNIPRFRLQNCRWNTQCLRRDLKG